MTEQQIADFLAAKAREVAYQGKLLQPDVDLINQLAGSLHSRFLTGAAPAPAYVSGNLTERAALELIEHEAIVLEAYYDNAKPPVLTWGIGVTSRSGHSVDRYKDKPQTIQRVLEIFVWLLRTNYMPAVLRAFKGRALTEHQFAAALSFHYNTGAIEETSWVKLWLAGKTAEAREFLETHYLNGGDLTKRRKLEAALFFDGKWTTDGRATVLGVRKPSYKPDWGNARTVDIREDLRRAMAA